MMTCSTSGEQIAPGFEGRRFRIDGGDGDQELFKAPLVLERVIAPWFDGNLGQLFGDAWLVRVTEGPKQGLLLGLTPRTLGNITDDVREGKWKSVVVHGIEYPGYDREAHGPPSAIGGMAFLDCL
jgi:hypothetical protein